MDLHSHSTASDGGLAPDELVWHAHNQGVTHLALTDHDTCAGIEAARQAAKSAGITLIPGIELSVSWAGRTIHVVGLGIDPAAPALQAFIKQVQAARQARAEAICDRLQKIGLTLDWRSIETHSIGRSHLAMAMVAAGWVKDHQKAFDYYLKQGKKGWVRAEWPALEDGVAAITAAGGIAVLAHPGVYTLSHAKMRALIEDFMAAGGEGIEVSTRAQVDKALQSAAERARQYGLYASQGSDFHHLAWRWRSLGRLAALPPELTPIMSASQLRPYFKDHG
ncbi:hypothetical protein SAMN05443662_1064 [Sulfurivirga caldicuralii]|uniref:Polymerase/histidinol phosphatase N-terminal domain-containing protein n=1 Tax=Sulfurivirga caldicuralii TaxID=364032 RepID=A0A1N6FG06_9GAMM|nr:PHP domain-containing protein [Sulfurivirga caldicuralii]SIN94177.1 hypothetical protein SAMN05443662_1064 [Sulfurivirga caldicuralii]